MTTHESIASELLEFVGRRLLGGKDAGLDGRTPLLELGIVDSLTLAGLVTFVHERFGVDVPAAEIVPENFENVEALARLVAALRGRVEEGTI